MYDKIKILLNHPIYRYIVIGGIGFILILCIGFYIFHEPSGNNDNNTLNTVERIERQQLESTKLNRDIQSSIDRSTELSHEAKRRVEQSTRYNIDIGNRINESQNAINEARSYLVRNAELFDRIERANQERQENNQTTTDATQPITDIRGGCDNRNCDTRIAR